MLSDLKSHSVIMVNDKAETDSGSGLYFTETMIKRRPVRICVVFDYLMDFKLMRQYRKGKAGHRTCGHDIKIQDNQ